MKYTIEFKYTTGDSFSSHMEIDTIEYKWSNLEIVKENLKRIKEHYEWVESKHSYSKNTLPEPECHKGLQEFSMKIKTDNNEEVIYHPIWIGYFERLHYAKIVFDELNGDTIVIF